ncbi:hypothetical protein XfCFBP8082_06310 [Xylella fastidiosa subsp. fastidiosa]|jgi:hypothetical protein|uniref:Uncharacterized protein n=1 Tax=Xylella fastidiosa (strain M23) TaxID=405441 RepID=B2I7G5_XYLF2|nr:hypothetical protein XfasM23_1655 [Xylella fastidiosa M23]EGO82207.1 hypothetical protein XFEB_00950 [Xylella fastidiosa EB92.1]NBI39325.1 hypothetical protein [Xylella fastidiosa subsp. fastidiosa]QIS25515.1 hypothetical protein F7G16_04390 [Xylella fastidiosa]RUA36686.1 hypothetical protein DX878_07860 [Xylella fastidiosa subsp. fastidiosa]
MYCIVYACFWTGLSKTSSNVLRAILHRWGVYFLLAGLIQVAPLCGDLILLTMQGVVSTCIRVYSVSALGGYVCDSWDGCSW